MPVWKLYLTSILWLGLLYRSYGLQIKLLVEYFIANVMTEGCTMLSREVSKGVSYCIRRGVAAAAAKTQSPRIPIYGVVFDLDGTLTLPVLDFAKLRQKLGCPHPMDILKFVNSKAEGERTEAKRIVEEFEDEGRKKTKLQPNVIDLLKFLSDQALKRALVTRNAQPSVDQFLSLLGSPDVYGGPFTHVSNPGAVSTQTYCAPVMSRGSVCVKFCVFDACFNDVYKIISVFARLYTHSFQDPSVKHFWVKLAS